jgi:hypothetical protein
MLYYEFPVSQRLTTLTYHGAALCLMYPLVGHINKCTYHNTDKNICPVAIKIVIPMKLKKYIKIKFCQVAGGVARV